jgi:hypothetical protein
MIRESDALENDRVINLSQELSDMKGSQDKLSNVHILYGIFTKMATEIEDLKVRISRLEAYVTPNWIDPIK